MKLAQLIAKTGEHEATIQVLCHLLKADRTNVFLLKDISDEIAEQTINIVKEYQKGMPLAYLLGHTYFYRRYNDCLFFIFKNRRILRWIRFSFLFTLCR